MTVEIEREEDGRWLAEAESGAFRAVPGALAYGRTLEEAVLKAGSVASRALTLRVLSERLEHGEPVPEIAGLFKAA